MRKTVICVLTIVFMAVVPCTMSSCNKTAENTNKPVIIQGFDFTLDGKDAGSVGTLQIEPGQVLTIKVKYTDPDAGDNPDPSWYSFAWSVERVNGGASSFNPNDNFVASDENPAIWTAPSVTGFYKFRVEVRDRYQTPSMENVVVEVNMNKKPVIDTLEVSNANPFVNEIVTITVTASDPDGNLPLEYVWQATGGYFTSESAGQAKWLSSQSGTFQITVNITDTANGTASRTIPINVQANHAPIIEGWVLDPDDVVGVDTLVTITLTATDEDNDVLEYNWSADKGTFSSINKNLAIWRAPSAAGSATITCVVEDNKGGSDTANIAIVVQ
jgi:hypothetical protein